MRRLVLGGLLCGALLLPATAQGLYHDMRITEVRPDPADGDFIELQMFSPGQNLLTSHWVTIYGFNGDLDGNHQFTAPVPNGGNQRTVLVGEAGAPGSPDVVDDALNISAGGGAACYLDTFPLGGIDCVSWGDFMGFPGGTPSPVGTNAVPGGIPAGQSIVRKTSGGSCATALDAADDTNESGNDFSLQMTPTPRNNSVAPTEQLCTQPTGAPAKKKKCKRKKKKGKAGASAKRKKCKKKKKKR
jgi:hypothetical protein